MRRTHIVAFFPLLVLSGCAWLGQAVTPVHAIDARTAGPLILDVCDQHDESVQRDPGLVDAEREQALRSTQIVRDIIEAAKGTQ